MFYVTNLPSVSAACITKTSVLQDGRFILEIIAVNNYFIISLFKCWLSKDNTKMDIKEIGSVGMGWIHLRQDRNMRQAVVKTVMNCGFYKLWGVSRLAEELVAYQDLLCSMQLVNIIWLTSWFLNESDTWQCSSSITDFVSSCNWSPILKPKALMARIMFDLAFGMTPCSLVDRNQCFIGTCSRT